jgi:hypothetical protein
LKPCVELWITAYEGLVDFGVTRDRHRHLRIASTLLRPNAPVRELTPGLVDRGLPLWICYAQSFWRQRASILETHLNPFP